MKALSKTPTSLIQSYVGNPSESLHGETTPDTPNLILTAYVRISLGWAKITLGIRPLDWLLAE